MNIRPGGTLITTMAFRACERCGNWHRPDFSCDTASKIIDINGPVSECRLCGKSHPSNITCAMEPDWSIWRHSEEAVVRSVWDKTLAEAWRDAQVIARLNNAIAEMDRTERRERTPRVSLG